MAETTDTTNPFGTTPTISQSSPFNVSTQTPDFLQAANLQAQGNLTGAQLATDANRINQYNPFGSLTYNQDPSGQWSQTMNLSPEMQALYGQYTGLGGQFGQAGQQALNQWGQIDPYGGVTPDAAGLQQVADTLYGAEKSRLDPQWAQKRSGADTQLYNQGLRPGGEAYTNAQRDLGYQENDAYLQARARAMGAAQAAQQGLFGMGQAASNQAMAQALQARGQTAPTNPQFNQYYQQQPTTGPNYLGALGQQYQGGLDIYNADIARQNAMLQGLYGLGTGILGLGTGSGTTLGGQLLSSAGTGLMSLFKNLFSGSTPTAAELESLAGVPELGLIDQYVPEQYVPPDYVPTAGE